MLARKSWITCSLWWDKRKQWIMLYFHCVSSKKNKTEKMKWLGCWKKIIRLDKKVKEEYSTSKNKTTQQQQ